jgi:PAS domain S-box-containing protein
VALVLAVLLPSLALGAATAWHMAGNYRAAFEERLSDTAQALALAVGREVQAHVAALTALAASPHLDDDDLAGFYPHARGAAQAIGTPVVVTGADLRQRLHTERPFGSPLPMTNAAEAIRTALTTGRPAVSDLLIGAVVQQPIIVVAVPILRGGRADAVLTAPLIPARLTGLLASQGLSDGAFATVMDSRDVIVARSRKAAEFIGRPAPTWVTQGMIRREAGVLRGRTLAGEDVIVAFQRHASIPGWTVVVGESLVAYQASWYRPLLALGAGGAATFLVALVAAAWLGRRVLRPVRALARHAEMVAVSGGEAPPLGDAPTRVAEFEALRRSMHRADAALRERETRLRAVVDTAVDAIIVIDERGVIQSANRAVEAIFGYTANEIVGRNVSLLMPAEMAVQHDGHLATYLRTGERRIIGIGREVEGQRKDGSRVALDLTIAEWRDAEGVRFFTGIMRDITQRKAGEAAVAESAARLRAIVDTAVDAIIVIDGRGLVQSFNRSAEAIFGYAAEEVVGQNVSMLMPEPDASRHDGYLAHYGKTGERRIIGIGREVEGRRKDGLTVPLDLSIAEWRDARGERFFTGIMRDITLRKEVEARQRILMREVDHRAKNALAVVQSVVRLTRAEDAAAYARAVEARVAALARAHTLLAEQGWASTDLRALVAAELAPYGATSVSLSGPTVPIAHTAAQPIGMALHELATNAAKHGALSRSGGTVTLRWWLEGGGLRLLWEERGGPPVAGPPTRRGFGSRLIEATVKTQLGGTVEKHWEPGGLVCEITVPLARAVAAETPPGDVAAIVGRAGTAKTGRRGEDAVSPVRQTAMPS